MFAELASHFPVAGSIYQWSKRLSNRTLGWFTGWFYFWAQVVTVTAVAVIVAYVIDGIMVQQEGFLDSPDPTGLTTMFTFISLVTLVITTLINAYRRPAPARRSTTSASAPRSSGMVVFALILLFFANHNPPSILLDTAGTEAGDRGPIPARIRARHVHGPLRRLRLRHGRDVRRGDDRREPTGAAGRAVVGRDLRHRRHDLPGRGDPGDPGCAHGHGPVRFPIADTITATLTHELFAGITVGEVYLFVILVSVFVCTLAIQGAATRMMFSMSRDRHLPGGGIWGRVNGTFKTPANAAIAVGRPGGDPDPRDRPWRWLLRLDRGDRPDLLELPLDATSASSRPASAAGRKKPAWFNLGRWGKLVNVLAILYGGLMLLNIAIWQDPNLFGNFGGAGRAITNPTIDTFIKPFGNEIAGMPAWPMFETLVVVLIVAGAIYYAISIRGRAHDVESADVITGEAIDRLRRTFPEEELRRGERSPRRSL